jgi:D-apiose dehydrogenase
MAHEAKPTLRGGLIGCGFFASRHLNAWRHVEGADVVAVCDLDEQLASRTAAEFEIVNHYGDAELMMANEDLDFVDIVTREDGHRALVEMGARHHLAVICQKPLASQMDDAVAMVRVCQAANVPFMTHENFRWQTPIRKVKQILAEGCIGDPFFNRVSFRSSRDIFANQPYLAEVSRFIILDLGIHLLDVTRFLMGEAASLMCHTSSVNPAVCGEDVATMLLRHRSGATSIVDMSYSTHVQPDPFPQTLIHIEGTQGTIDLEFDYQIRITQGNEVETLDAAPEPLDWLTPPARANQESVLRIQQHFVDCLRTGRAPETNGTDNLKTLQLVFAAYESAEQRRDIVIPGS